MLPRNAKQLKPTNVPPLSSKSLISSARARKAAVLQLRAAESGNAARRKRNRSRCG